MTEERLRQITHPGLLEAELLAEVRRLKQELAEARGLIEHWVLKHAQAVADNDRLRAALRQYGQHDLTCPQPEWSRRPCTCGLKEALEGTEPGERG